VVAAIVAATASSPRSLALPAVGLQPLPRPAPGLAHQPPAPTGNDRLKLSGIVTDGAKPTTVTDPG